MESDIEYVVWNLRLNDKWINFFILEFKSLSSETQPQVTILSIYLINLTAI